MSGPRGAASPDYVPTWCATCQEDRASLRPQRAKAPMSGRWVTLWLCADCWAMGCMATLKTFEIRDPERSGVHARSAGRGDGRSS